jgi:hypothetical protein
MTARVPRLKNSGYRLLGLMLSEKSWTYLLAGQMILSGGTRTIIPALSGLLAGYMYDKDYCSMQSYRFPRFIEVRPFWSDLFWPKVRNDFMAAVEGVQQAFMWLNQYVICLIDLINLTLSDPIWPIVGDV